MLILKKLREHRWIVLFVIYLRYLIGGAMIFASVVKIEGNRFTSNDGIDAPIRSGIHFFETLYQSGLYWNFIGWSQFLVGMLLMTQWFSTLGALALLPITTNIFFITLSYDFSNTPIITGLILLANIFLVIWDYDKLLPLLKTIKKGKILDMYDRSIESNRIWLYLGTVLFLITTGYVIVFGRSPIYWFTSCSLVGLIGLIYYFWSSKVK